MAATACKSTVPLVDSIGRFQTFRKNGTSRRSVRRPLAVSAASAKSTIQLRAEELTPASFEPFGQVISWIDDMKAFDEEDAQLDLSNGTPRFYIMRLPETGVTFDTITHHARVTQCLGSLTPESWYMAVAAPGATPSEETMKVFKVPHGTYIKMEAGTWHAGPLFKDIEHIDFYNLELSDTNQVDHNRYNFMAEGIQFEVVDEL